MSHDHRDDAYSRSRRKFLSQTLQSLTMLAAGTASMKSQARAAVQDGLVRKRYLVNIVSFGGWDAQWFHNAINPVELMLKGASDVALTADDLKAPKTPLLGQKGAIMDATGNGYLFPNDIFQGYGKTVVDAGAAESRWHFRAPESLLTAHPNYNRSHYLGPGMKAISSDIIKNDLLIWKGLQPEAGHMVGNTAIQCGAIGETYPSFSATVAYKLAQEFTKPLHYVQITNSQNDLFTQTGNLNIDAVNIPNLDAWNNLTTRSIADPTNGRRDYISSAIERLANEVINSSFALKRSQEVYTGFVSSFRAATKALTLNDKPAAENLKDLTKIYHERIYGTVLATDGFIKNHIALLSDAMTNGNLASYYNWNNYFNDLAFRFALTEYLIVNDLSAVIDLRADSGDYHDGVDSQIGQMMANFSAIGLLIERLKAKGLLDKTTIIHHTEFDRTPTLYANSPSAYLYPGTGHWEYSTSLLMAGMGVQGGKVVGDFKRGSNFERLPDAKYPYRPYTPVPIDVSTGEAKSEAEGGKRISTFSIFPTILSIFEATALSQVSDGPSPVAAVMKKVA